MTARHTLRALALLAVPAGALPAQAPSGPAIVREASVEGITAYRIPSNGMRVLLYPDQSKPQTLVNVTYLVGSRQEGYGETGMAHLLEHMLVKGTPTHPDIAAELEARGASYNASTSFDRTNYFEIFSAADSTLDWALGMEADRMLHSRVSRQDLDKEFSVVRNEFESGENSPTLVTIKRVLGSAYLFHAYGRLPIGSQSDIEHVPIDRLQAFYHRFYQPDNAVLLIAGKFDTTKALAMVQKYFAPLPKPARELPQTYTVEPTQDGEREVWVRRAGNEQDIVDFYHVPAGSSPDFAAVDVLQHLLTDAPSGRLYKALVETKKAASVDALPLQLHDPGGLMLIVSMRKEDTLATARAALLKALDDLVTSSPPTQQEVDRARTAIESGIAQALNNTAGVGLALSDWMAIGDWRLFFLHRDEVRKVTPADVQRVAAAYLKSSNRTLGYFVPTDKPDRAEIPPAPDIAALVKDYRGQAAVATGEAFDPSPANIMQRTTTFTTKAGVKAALLPKKTHGETVNAVLVLHFGDLESLRGRSQAVGAAAEMLMRGTTMHTRQQLRDSLDKLKARLAMSGGGNSVRVTIQATHATLPAVLSLADEVLHHPSFDTTEFGALVRENAAALEAQAKEPTALALVALQRKLAPYPRDDPRYVASFDEQAAALRALRIDDVRRAYADFFGAGTAELAVVGDFDAGAVRAQVDTMLTGWTTRHPYAVMHPRLFGIAASHEDIRTPDKANAMFLAGTELAMSDHDPDYAAMTLANYIMGGGTLTSRLTDRIRVKDGLSYAAQSVLQADSRDAVAHFLALAIHAPQNADKVQADFFDELARARRDGFTADELDKARTGLLQNAQLTRAQDPILASTLASDLFLGRTLQFDADFEARVKATTLEQVNAAWRKYIDPDKFAVVRAGDFDRKP